MKMKLCMNCQGQPDHNPGGPFCKVISKVALQQKEISKLYDLLAEKNLMVEDILQTANRLQAVVDSLKARQPLVGNA